MLTWLIRGVVAGAVAGVSYVVGRRRGGKAVAQQMLTDRALGRKVITRLAEVHGVELMSMFEVDGDPAGPPA